MVLHHMPWCALPVLPPTGSALLYASVAVRLELRSKCCFPFTHGQGWIKGAIRAAQYEFYAVRNQSAAATPSL